MTDRAKRVSAVVALAVALAIGGTGASLLAGCGQEEPAGATPAASEPRSPGRDEAAARAAPPLPAPAPAAESGSPPAAAVPAGGPGSGPAGPGLRDCDVCPALVAVPAGEYMMGAPASDKDGSAQERPQHRVRIDRPFLVGTHEVTFAQWDACVADQGCLYRPDDFGWGRDDRPVMLVSWDDVQEYLGWLRAKTGKPYRLPSEAEWEFVHRAGTTTRYWWGDTVGTGHANCKGCGSQWDDRQTAPVGSFRPNAFGLYDTSGNVWEWVADCWVEDFTTAGSDASAVPGPPACERRVLRGGSWINKPGNLRASARAWGAVDGRVNIVGFRVTRDR